MCRAPPRRHPVETGEISQRLAQFHDSQSDYVLLAMSGGHVVGLIAVSITPLLVEGAFARITATVVNEAHRGSGIGRALVAEAERLARAAACSVIQVSSGNRPERDTAHRFYARLGYTDAGTHHTLFERQVVQPTS